MSQGLVGLMMNVPGGMSAEQRLKDVERLAQRKTLQSILGRVLSAKRVLRMIGRYVEGELVEDIPIVNDIVGVRSLADDLDLAQAMAGDEAETSAAIDFVKNGPYDLSQLQMSPDTPKSLSSFDAFKKTDMEKQFGPAGDGYDYHHIVEQGPNAEAFSQSHLQSTDNIVRIPRLLHEEVSSIYSSADMYSGRLTTPRAYFRGQSFEAQRQYGLQQLREVGILH